MMPNFSLMYYHPRQYINDFGSQITYDGLVQCFLTSISIRSNAFLLQCDSGPMLSYLNAIIGNAPPLDALVNVTPAYSNDILGKWFDIPLLLWSNRAP